MLAEEAEEGEAERAAQLYIWLRCGFAFLPSGTAVAPQWRRNYESALEAASDITLELRRLIQQGHLIDFDEARRRFASCRHLSRPTIVLAMGLIRKLNEDGTEKLRVVLDASGEDASGVSLNNLIDIDNFPTKLPSVQRYADALALLGPRAQLFKVDLTDSYFCFPISDDSVPLVGIYWQGRFLVYHSLVFGVNSSVHAFQLLSIAVSRGCMRRWRAAGIHCFDAPSLVDQSQPWPSAHPALPRRGSRAMSAPDIRYDDVRRDHTTMDDSSVDVIQASQPEVASPEVTTHLTDPNTTLMDVATAVGDAIAGEQSRQDRRTLSSVVSLHHNQDVRAAFMAPYIDDFAGVAIGPAPSVDLHRSTLALFDGGVAPLGVSSTAEFCYGSLHSVLLWLGLPANFKPGKSVPPQNSCDILGIGFTASRQVIFLTPERVHKMIGMLSTLIATNVLTVFGLQSAIGLLVFASIVLPAAKPYLSASLAALRSLGPRPASYTRLTVNDDMRSDWDMWRHLLRLLNGRPISRGVHLPRIMAAAFSDASFEGGGYFWGGRWRSWRWPVSWQRHMGPQGQWRITINTLEAVALLIMLRDILPVCGPDRLLHLYLDNTTVQYSVRKLRSRSAPLNLVFREIALLLCYWGTVTRSHFVDSKSNECADVLSRTSTLSPMDVEAVVHRWTTTHPDCTHWQRVRPGRPEVFSLLQAERWSFSMLP
jgi:hypothetical protein